VRQVVTTLPVKVQVEQNAIVLPQLRHVSVHRQLLPFRVNPVEHVMHPEELQVAQVLGQIWHTLPFKKVPEIQFVQARGEGLQVIQLDSKDRQETALLVGP
jgi:hypothetical protein